MRVCVREGERVNIRSYPCFLHFRLWDIVYVKNNQLREREREEGRERERNVKIT